MRLELTLESTVYEKDQLVLPDALQIALAGRSNVGKSSLINCLAGRKSLARISSSPGKTRSLNFYRVEAWSAYLVDLPGYGYAKCSKSERAKWSKLIDLYLRKANNLAAVVVLLDSRLPPQKIDMELTDYLRSLDIAVIPVLTKADKCKQAQRAALLKQWAELLPGSSRPLLFSSVTGFGRDKLALLLAKLAGAVPNAEGETTDAPLTSPS